ncbi:MAG: hypothetical protein ACRDPT_02870, partial [Streptomycetales bacterium]
MAATDVARRAWGRSALLVMLLAGLVAPLPPGIDTLDRASAASADGAGSLYGGPGPRPGPDVLYRPPARAPQLSNGGPWQAEPILISGASAYRDGEFLYQDFL